MEIQLIDNRKPMNFVHKELHFGNTVTLNGTLRDSNSVSSIVVTVDYDVEEIFRYNYAHISELNRYYYISDIEIVSNRLFNLFLSVDVLTTYAKLIENTTAFIDRNQFDYSIKLNDDKRIIKSGIIIEDNVIDNDVFVVENNGEYNTMYSLSGFQIGEKWRVIG